LIINIKLNLEAVRMWTVLIAVQTKDKTIHGTEKQLLIANTGLFWHSKSKGPD
jgi:hypothetical protein